MHMFRRVLGTIGCLALSGMGIAVMVGAISAEELAESSERRGRSGGIAAVMKWLLESVGAIPTGLIVLVLALAILAAMWVPVIRCEKRRLITRRSPATPSPARHTRAQ